MPKNQPISQKGTGGMSAKINYAVGSGSRPTGGKIKIPSSNPKSAKNHKAG